MSNKICQSCYNKLLFRWLSQRKASVRFIKCYEELLDTFDAIIHDSRDPEVQEIRHCATRKDVITMILVLAGVMKPVNHLSLYLQRYFGTFTELPVKVKKCTDDIHEIVNNYQTMNLTGPEFRRKDHDSLVKVYQNLAGDEIVRESFPTMLQLYKLALLVPQSTAAVERGFSAMNDICTDVRSLGQQSLDCLMRINLWPDQLAEADFEQIVDMFRDRKKETCLFCLT